MNQQKIWCGDNNVSMACEKAWLGSIQSYIDFKFPLFLLSGYVTFFRSIKLSFCFFDQKQKTKLDYILLEKWIVDMR